MRPRAGVFSPGHLAKVLRLVAGPPRGRQRACVPGRYGAGRLLRPAARPRGSCRSPRPRAQPRLKKAGRGGDIDVDAATMTKTVPTMGSDRANSEKRWGGHRLTVDFGVPGVSSVPVNSTDVNEITAVVTTAKRPWGTCAQGDDAASSRVRSRVRSAVASAPRSGRAARRAAHTFAVRSRGWPTLSIP